MLLLVSMKEAIQSVSFFQRIGRTSKRIFILSLETHHYIFIFAEQSLQINFPSRFKKALISVKPLRHLQFLYHTSYI